MPRAKSDKSRAPTWNPNGCDADQLFRDCHFGKYSDKTPYNEIHNDPSRKYSVYNAKYFVGHCKKMLKRVLQWQSLSQGLDTIRFKELVDLDKSPSLLDQGRAQAPVPVQLAHHYVPVEDAESIDDDDRDDESYILRADNDSEDEDWDDDDCDRITLECGSFDMESAFDELKLHGKIYDARAPQKGGAPGLIDMNVKRRKLQRGRVVTHALLFARRKISTTLF
jgi:hypothetical protein